MAISHELSSEIAAALFAAKDRTTNELNDLKEILLVVHSTLERLSDDAHLARIDRLNSHSARRQVAKHKSATS
jgi:hypothetical protein